jgi:hypothetical protein
VLNCDSGGGVATPYDKKTTIKEEHLVIVKKSQVFFLKNAVTKNVMYIKTRQILRV